MEINVFELSDKLFNEGNYTEAVRILNIAIETEPHNWYSYFRKGKCYQFMNQFQNAISIYKIGLDCGDIFDLNRGIGECFLVKEEWLEAKRYLFKAYGQLQELENLTAENERQAKNFSYDKANILNNLAVAYYNLSQLNNCVTCCEKGIEFDPNYAANYTVLGTIYVNNNDPRGIELLKKASKLGDLKASAILNNF